jgi:hypothetical protein
MAANQQLATGNWQLVIPKAEVRGTVASTDSEHMSYMALRGNR